MYFNKNKFYPKMAERMSKFKDEISHWVEYDYVVINNKLETCVDEILSIVHVERKKRRRQLNLVNKVPGSLQFNKAILGFCQCEQSM